MFMISLLNGYIFINTHATIIYIKNMCLLTKNILKGITSPGIT